MIEVSHSKVDESIGTATSGGKLIFRIFGALAEFERNLICERTMAGQQEVRGQSVGDRQPWMK